MLLTMSSVASKTVVSFFSVCVIRRIDSMVGVLRTGVAWLASWPAYYVSERQVASDFLALHLYHGLLVSIEKQR